MFEAICDGNSGAARNNMIALLDMTEEVLERAEYGAAIAPEMPAASWPTRRPRLHSRHTYTENSRA